MPNLSIGELAKRTGVRTSAIRYYERVGLLPKASRVNGRRRYDEIALERLAIIRFAKRVGFGIADMGILLNGAPGRPQPERWRKLAHEKIADLDRLVVEASAVREMLLGTLDQKCPKLVERGRALADARPVRLAQVSRTIQSNVTESDDRLPTQRPTTRKSR
jgi:MerR family transcriptional regulator, redox-sensitive transcriptional activator SoxR